ncbi:MAG: hypothetical protein RL386_1125, partial [Bacteroidota bacterium]
SLREIMKNKSPSKEYYAAEGGKNLFTQPPSKEYCAAEGGVLPPGQPLIETLPVYLHDKVNPFCWFFGV